MFSNAIIIGMTIIVPNERLRNYIINNEAQKQNIYKYLEKHFKNYLHITILVNINDPIEDLVHSKQQRGLTRQSFE